MTLPKLVPADRALIAAFEAQLDPAAPTAGDIPVRVIGYGEMSTVLEIGGQGDRVYKRIAGFRSASEAEAHADAIRAYCDALRDAGVDVAETQPLALHNDHGEHLLYLVQPRVPAERVGNAYCGRVGEARFAEAIEAVLRHYAAIWRRNREHPGGEALGLDGQISNWAFLDSEVDVLHPVYFDVGLPLMRRGGVEVMDVEIGLRTLPPPLAWIVRAAFLSEVLNRYYDLHEVLLDLVGNFRKEGYPDKIPAALEIVNGFLDGPAKDLGIAPLRRDAVDAYYRRDVFIWRVFLGLRRLDRLVQTRLLRRRYPFILPGRIKRW